jgi:ubiquinone/menaquinone biosynthesis C-methylase UbiE
MDKPHASHRVCPVEQADAFDSRLRHWLQNPSRILGPHVRPGMRVLDYGCGPGYFLLPLAQMVGPGGQVVGADLQHGMLARAAGKLRNSPLGTRVRLHQCTADADLPDGCFDFVLACYVLHELPDQDAWFARACARMQPGARMLVMEPPVHVSRRAFRRSLSLAGDHGLACVARPWVFFAMAAVLQKD